MIHYQQGLKEFLKFELLRKDEPEDLSDLIEMAVKIDNRFHEHGFMKKHKTGYKSNTGKKHHAGHRKDYGDPMEIDQVSKKPFKKSQKGELQAAYG
jgi:hypothetical protein